MVQRYREAREWWIKTIRENPQFPGGHRLLAASCGQLDRKKEAQNALKGLLLLMPGMTIDDVMQKVPFKKPGDMKRCLDGLRKAGLPD